MFPHTRWLINLQAHRANGGPKLAEARRHLESSRPSPVASRRCACPATFRSANVSNHCWLSLVEMRRPFRPCPRASGNDSELLAPTTAIAPASDGRYDRAFRYRWDFRSQGSPYSSQGFWASCLTPALTFEPTRTASSSGSSTRGVAAEKCSISPGYFSGHRGLRFPPRAVSLAKILFRQFYFG